MAAARGKNVRRAAWAGGTRPPASFSQPPNPPRNATAAMAPYVQPQPNGNPPPRDRVLHSWSGLTGTTVTVSTKTGQRYEGVVGSTTTEGEAIGLTLKDAKDLNVPGAPVKDQLLIGSASIESCISGPTDAKLTNGDSFRTDTDISQKKAAGRERELQAWVPSSETPAAGLNGSGGDDDTFGPGTIVNTSWDQFAVNEQMFGVKTSFDEDVYTTKLDRSAPDYKERERKAQRLANEILGTASNNPHIAEERGLAVDDSGVNEEDKYGAVVRGTNAYVPPGARKMASTESSNPVSIPRVSINGPDGHAIAPQFQPSSSKAVSPAPPTADSKPRADALPAFREFVTSEKNRLTQKRQALQKSEMDKRMLELVKFSQTFKLNKPIPDDLIPILAQDERKQHEIKRKSVQDASSSQARAIGASAVLSAARVNIAPAKNSEAARELARKVASPLWTAGKATNNAAVQSSASAETVKAPSAPTSVDSSKKSISMVIQTIPPFKGNKTRQLSSGNSSASAQPSNGNMTSNSSLGAPSRAALAAAHNSPNAAAINNRLNVNASSFRPNTKASDSQSAATQVSSTPLKPKPESAHSAPNPFFGTRSIKKSPPAHIKDDFNPFQHGKVPDPATVAATWPYNGKRYMQMFPPLQHQPPQQHVVIPPPSYEEDSAAVQAAQQRGYIYPYPHYGYSGQPMMAGMAPHGPPGAYIPGPYMQPMHYGPGMPPPPNAMYSSAMGQMPQYMPPPGAYQNGGGSRPSMPPTPIPAHAHPYYHQSPQLQHAIPFQMMMPPQPNVPYEGGPVPPVQMGGHA